MSREPDLDEPQHPPYWPTQDDGMGCYSCAFCGARDDTSCGCAEFEALVTGCPQVKCDECERLSTLTSAKEFLAATDWDNSDPNSRIQRMHGDGPDLLLGNCQSVQHPPGQASTRAIEIMTDTIISRKDA